MIDIIEYMFYAKDGTHERY